MEDGDGRGGRGMELMEDRATQGGCRWEGGVEGGVGGEQ
jgi:hypothetical protein